MYTKYCTSSDYGTVDNKTTLELEDDAAHANWGGNWRMPTFVEIKELESECRWKWTTQNGVNGNKVIGPNGNFIFLPAAGNRWGSVYSVGNAGSYGFYWSSSLSRYGDAYSLNFNSGDTDWYYGDRRSGLSVRAVCP